MVLFNEKETPKKNPIKQKTTGNAPIFQEKKRSPQLNVLSPKDKKQKTLQAEKKAIQSPKKVKKKNTLQNDIQEKKQDDKKKKKFSFGSKKTKEKSNQKTSKKKEKEKKPKVKRSIAEIIPLIDITPRGHFELRSNEFMNIFQIQSEDLYSKNKGEKEYYIYSQAYFRQAYSDPIKEVAMNFPCETKKQQANLQKKLARCKNPMHEKFLKQKLEELRFLEVARTNREYFLFIYGKTEEILEERSHAAKRFLQRSSSLIEIDVEKKLDILYKLYNQNSKIGSGIF